MPSPAPPIAAAAAGPTWGISGPTFLWVYALAFLVVVAGAWLARRTARGVADAEPCAAGALTPDEIGLLTAGENHAALVTVAGLYDAGFLRSAGWRAIAVARPADRTVGDLGREALRAVEAAGRIRVSRLTRDLVASPAMGAVRARLGARGLLPTERQVRVVRAAGLGYLALLAVGVARAVAGARNGRPIGFLVLELVVVGLGAIHAARARPTTPRARAAVATLRNDLSDLRSGGLPGDRALAAAVFGAAVLWAADPALASGLGVARAAAGGSSGYAGTSCGGGSSCGGGGGCGGGGCGG